MAFINGLYIHVIDEDLDSDNEISEHSVEEGIDITDTVKPKGNTLTLLGKIVDYEIGGEKVKASTIISTLKQHRSRGTLITYEGRNFCQNMQIKNFTTKHPNTIMGGANFNMELKECRIVKNAYVAPKKDTSVKDGGKQQVEKGDNTAVYYTVKKGDCIWNLVALSKSPYRNLKREGEQNTPMGRCNWVMSKNPKAFSRKGDFRTLQIGKKLLMGYR